MSHRTLIAASLFLIAGLALHAPTALAQKSAEHPGGHGEKSAMTKDCQAMMEKMKVMNAKQEQIQKVLDEMVDRMESAEGEAQQAAMVDLLTKLVATRKTMHAMMAEMRPAMMQHMAGHMSSGGGMDDCPMMGSGHGSDGGDHPHQHHH